MFIGRSEHLEALLNLKKLNTAQLVVCQGRRRIGKSSMIRQVGKKWAHYVEIQGLSPNEKTSNQDQINYFLKQFAQQTGVPEVKVQDWDSALRILGKFFEKKEAFIFLDEISWLGGRDHKFCGILKTVWDTLFSQNPKLIVVLCGSVSSWIEDNILQNTNFLGRISMQIQLKEMPIFESKMFFKKNTSPSEILKYLLVTGGVPRYLEEAKNDIHPTQVLARQLLRPIGFLFNEYDRIFIDIFGRRHKTYSKIVEVLKNGQRQFSEICDDASLPKNGKTSKMIHHLILSGFVRADEPWTIKGDISKRGTMYRLSDNYLLFYKRAIQPLKKKIEQNMLGFKTFDQIPNLQSVSGYQFENLIYNNIDTILKVIGIEHEEIINWGPYRQTKTLRSEACQIDLLIQTKNILYLFEIKHKAHVDTQIIKELMERTKKLKYPSKLYSVRTGIIYSHEISSEILKKRMVDFYISFEDLLI